MGRRNKKVVKDAEEELPEIPNEKKLFKKTNHLNSFKLKKILPKTKNQQKVFDSYDSGKNLYLTGCAGVGKSYLALYLALRELYQRNFKKIVVVRSIVPSRNIGFMPGDLSEKTGLYETPYRTIVMELLQDRTAYDTLKKSFLFDFITTSFVRGTTIDDSIIILDEIQNFTYSEIYSVLTRVGDNSRVIICGDHVQNDLINDRNKQDTGIFKLNDVINVMECFDMIKFEVDDICRSGFVKDFILADQYVK